MPRGYVIDASQKDDSVRVPVGDLLIVGRTVDCGYVLDDSAASRQHMEIIRRGEAYFWRDLDSTNGVYHNEKKIAGGELNPGDRLRIGKTTLVFRDESEEAHPLERPDRGTSRILKSISKSGPQVQLSESEVLLEAVHEVMNDIASNYEPCSLVDRILETTIKAINAQRGAVFFAEPGSEKLLPCPVCKNVHAIEEGVLKHADSENIRVTRTVARRVLRDGDSVLVQDTGSAEALDTSESIVSLELRSIICAPIRGKLGVMGILYVDTDRAEQFYTHGHMLLSTAVGNSAGLALENAQMHQQILKNELVERELEYAGTIQEGFLVHQWDFDDTRYDVYGETRPAKAVGGDFYDFVQVDSDRLGILIGDVSGKGVASALAMAQILAEFRVHVRTETSPAAVLAALNESLCERSKRGMFCTLCYLSLDLTTGTALCANAGHHPVLHVTRIETSEAGHPTGPPVGIIRDTVWQDVEMKLAKQDTIILYTDGIIEARSAGTRKNAMEEPDEYGLDAMRSLVQKNAANAPKEIVGEVLREVRRYSEPIAPHDDCTILTFRYMG